MDTVSTPKNHVVFAKKYNGDKVDIGIVIVSWNVKDALIRNLESLYESQGSVAARMIVVDNASKDGTVEQITTRFPDVIIIANQDNFGFAKAVNQGMAAANARHILLLNPDMVIKTDSLEKTVRYLDGHRDVGILGARLSRPDGSILHSVRRFPDFKSQLVVLLKLSKFFPKILSHYLLSDFDYSREQGAPSFRGSYFAISERGLQKLPRLDERYFIWFEEVDYCRAMSETGLKTMYVPDIQVTDLFGQSFKQRTACWKQKNFTKSMDRYFWKWRPGIGAAVISCLRPLVVGAAWLHDLLI